MGFRLREGDNFALENVSFGLGAESFPQIPSPKTLVFR
jgi:hypothetical protein